MPKNDSPSIEANFIKIHDDVGNVVETENALGALFKVSLFHFILSSGKFSWSCCMSFFIFFKMLLKRIIEIEYYYKRIVQNVRKSKAGPQNWRFVRHSQRRYLYQSFKYLTLDQISTTNTKVGTTKDVLKTKYATKVHSKEKNPSLVSLH